VEVAGHDMVWGACVGHVWTGSCGRRNKGLYTPYFEGPMKSPKIRALFFWQKNIHHEETKTSDNNIRKASVKAHLINESLRSST
jgi:hypothetical protein